ncbi:MAG: bifunctional diaminohydroxyphosphoribosylaminopyrimidine deaminase/5-amino-6-(5-phosphoribosylamino)uracil reductase RibD [Neomegalonema sp.]|nr:bifunctional diaminohydroxyphosphoribosylaminopyrimidine deaminase/5-amino-6-(5-phosphoribosylamino)uracil reductase RibD [Neomegalonema sp.]
MQAALNLAQRGVGQTWPNPSVGCVIVKDGVLIARGWTQPGGRPHAEAIALAAAGAAARGATLYVTLEPCAHHGKTPPCASTIVAAGIARVVSALEDPDPRVAGRGHQILREAEIALDVGIEAAAAAQLNAGYLRRRSVGMPTLTLKLALTLDGKIAAAPGQRTAISSPLSLPHVHLMRARHDAILIGSGTALADDPRLDVRLPGLEARTPVRVVLDSQLRTPPGGQLIRSASSERPVWLIHDDTATKDRLARLRSLPGVGLFCIPSGGGGGLDLRAALHCLADNGIGSVMCEGGARLATALLTAGLVNTLVTAHCGKVFGHGAQEALTQIEDTRFRLIAQERWGQDIVSRWTPCPPDHRKDHD